MEENKKQVIVFAVKSGTRLFGLNFYAVESGNIITVQRTKQDFGTQKAMYKYILEKVKENGCFVGEYDEDNHYTCYDIIFIEKDDPTRMTRYWIQEN